MATNTKVNRRSPLTVALIASASGLGYASRASFGKAVAAASKLVPSNFLTVGFDGEGKLTDAGKRYSSAIQEFGDGYKAGHLVAYLEPHYGAKRWGNMSEAQRVESALEILGKPEPDSDKPNRRTALEHGGCRAAISAWSHLKTEAGLKRPPAQRTKAAGASKRRAAGDEKPVPTARITVPRFIAPIDAVPFFQNVANDLLKACASPACPIAFKSAVQDFRKAIREGTAALKASATRSTKARATKGTVSAATIASRMQNPAKGNGAAVN